MNGMNPLVSTMEDKINALYIAVKKNHLGLHLMFTMNIFPTKCSQSIRKWEEHRWG